MGKQLIALCASDIHFHDWKQFNDDDVRTLTTTGILRDLFYRSHEEAVPILMPGDLFHTPKGLSTKTLLMFTEFMKNVRYQFYRAKMVGITGNHDGNINSSLYRAMSYAFPEQIICIDDNQYELGDIQVIGLAYARRNIDIVAKIKTASHTKGKKILMLHTELYGAPDPSGYEPNPQNFSRESLALFKDFDLVLAGHIHKHTQVSDNVYMVGAPNQQRKSDAGTEMGYLEVYDDFSVEFIPLKTPTFRYFKEGEEHEDTDDYWTEIPTPKKIKKQSEAEFRPTMEKGEMAKRYAKETGIKNKRKINALINILSETDD